MRPPLKRAYAYFRHDAEIYIPANRPGWSTDDIKYTISALWAGSDRIKAHYAGSENQNSGPGIAPVQNEIPAIAYTEAEAEAARKTRQLPAPRVAAPQPQHLPPPPPPAGPSAYPPAEAQPVPSLLAPSANVDTMPHHFWPQMPWLAEPKLDPLHNDIRNPEAVERRNAWLAGSPEKEASETLWHGVKFLGAGRFGAAGLWVELDEDRNITNRMAVKDVKSTASLWRDPQNWRNRLPREIWIHQLVEERRSDEPGCEFLVRSHGYRVFMEQTRYRIYLDYYDASDLSCAMVQHFQRQTDQDLPEEFIWYMAKALTSACIILQRGTMSDEALESWKPITHLDLKMPNILLAFKKRKREDGEDEELRGKRLNTASDTEIWTDTNWQNLPLRPVLADFGQAFYSLNNGACPISDNPRDFLLYDLRQTRYAPEHQWQSESPWVPLGEKTDVWGIGSILWYLITHRFLYKGPVREDFRRGRIPNDDEEAEVENVEDEEQGFEDESIDEEDYLAISDHIYTQNRTPNDETTLLNGNVVGFAKSDNYTELLKSLVRACLNWSQNDRPTLQQILELADDALRTPGTQAVLRDWEEFQLALSDDPDEFKIGEQL